MGGPFPVETLPRDELEKLQNKRLRYTLRQAYRRVLFWHEKFDSLGIKPKDIKNKEDLLKAYEMGLKVTKEDLVIHPFELLPDYVRRGERTVTYLWTSGFTGRPKIIPFTNFWLHNDTAVHTCNAIGIGSGDRVVVGGAPAPFSSGLIMEHGLRKYPYPIRYQHLWIPLRTVDLMRLFKRFRPTHYLTYPTKLYDLGEEIRGLGEEPSLLNLRALLIGGEGCEKEKRAKMETLWDAPIYEALTTTEAGLYGYECKPYEGLHVLESRIIFATCKPEQGEILGEGEEGDDLVTTLYDVGERPGIFLINYSHGDVTKILSTERCECDRTFVKIDYIKRKDEIINLRAVKFYAREPERVPGIKDYICILNKEEGLLEIRVVAEKDYTPERLMKEVLDVFYATNPAAANFVGKYINVKIVEREELHRGLQIPPGKPVRLVVV